MKLYYTIVFITAIVAVTCKNKPDWNVFFATRCTSEPAPEDLFNCPEFKWNPDEGCFPWNTLYCELQSLGVNYQCTKLICNVSTVATGFYAYLCILLSVRI